MIFHNQEIFVYSIIWLVLFVITCFLIQQIISKIIYIKKIKKLPGPDSHPIFGDSLQIIKESDRIFYALRKWSKNHFPIYKLLTYPYVCVNIVRPEDIEIITSTKKHSEKGYIYSILRPWLREGLLLSNGDKWRQRRKLLTPAFHFTILQDFIAVFHKESLNLINEFNKVCHQDSINVSPLLAEFALSSINESSMGVKLDLENKLDKSYMQSIKDIGRIFIYRLSHPFLYVQCIYYCTTLFFREFRLTKILHKYTDAVITKKLQSLKESTSNNYSKRKRLAMLDLLIEAQQKGHIDLQGIQEEISTFIFEGHDTTSMALSFSMMLLAMNPQVQQQILEEIFEIWPDPSQEPTYQQLNELKYTEMVIKECLRLYPSVPLISRLTEEDITLEGDYKIPQGTNLNIHIFDLHRNPNIYPDPEKFDPDRFLPENTINRHPFAYIPFSAGPRSCIGQRFALMEMKTVLCAIVRNFILEPKDTPETLEIVADLVLRPKQGVKVKLVQRPRNIKTILN